MDQLPPISYLDTLDDKVNLLSQNLSGHSIQGGYVEFSILEETYVHFFTSAHALKFIGRYLKQGKPLKGLRQYIMQYYAPQVLGVHELSEQQIIIWNYEFDLSTESQPPAFSGTKGFRS